MQIDQGHCTRWMTQFKSLTVQLLANIHLCMKLWVQGQGWVKVTQCQGCNFFYKELRP